ncbi:integrase core domain-containing protein [Streptomyces sp. AD2-2]|nr:integrase core domain-containing protein [Streptomyces sp. AD2-2]
MFFATIKRELLDTTVWPSRAAARTAIFDFIEGWYNLHRLHSSLSYRVPLNTRLHSQSDDHTDGVRQSETSSTADWPAPTSSTSSPRWPATSPHRQLDRHRTQNTTPGHTHPHFVLSICMTCPTSPAESRHWA